MGNDFLSGAEHFRRYEQDREDWDEWNEMQRNAIRLSKSGKSAESDISSDPPPDIVFQGYPVRFKSNGNNSVSVIVDQEIKPTDDMIRDYGPNKEEKKQIKAGTFFFHRQFKGSYQIGFDRYGRIISETAPEDASVFQTDSNVPLDFRTNKNNTLPFTTIDVVKEYQKQNGKYPDGINPPEPLPEYFVFKTFKNKLPVTYVFWNGERSREENGLPSSVKAGVFAYYDLEEKDVTDSFRAVFTSTLTTSEAARRVDLIMPLAKPSSLSAQNSNQQAQSNETTQLVPNSYEEYKWNHGSYDMIENNQVVQKPVKDAIGHYAPDAYTYNNQSKTYNRTNSKYYSGIPAMFPPQKLNAQFKSNESDVPDDVTDSPNYSKKQFLADIEDILTYLYFYPNVSIHIIGHTSKKGGSANQKLSEDRASKTRNYLESLKVTIGSNVFSLGQNSGRVTSEGVGSRDAKGKDDNDDSPEDRYIEIIYSVK